MYIIMIMLHLISSTWNAISFAKILKDTVESEL